MLVSIGISALIKPVVKGVSSFASVPAKQLGVSSLESARADKAFESPEEAFESLLDDHV